MKRKYFPKPYHYHGCSGLFLGKSTTEHPAHIYACHNPNCRIMHFDHDCGVIADANYKYKHVNDNQKKVR